MILILILNRKKKYIQKSRQSNRLEMHWFFPVRGWIIESERRLPIKSPIRNRNWLQHVASCCWRSSANAGNVNWCIIILIVGGIDRETDCQSRRRIEEHVWENGKMWGNRMGPRGGLGVSGLSDSSNCNAHTHRSIAARLPKRLKRSCSNNPPIHRSTDPPIYRLVWPALDWLFNLQFVWIYQRRYTDWQRGNIDFVARLVSK